MSTPAQDLGGPLRYRLEKRPDATCVFLSGQINEATNFAALTRLPGVLVFDLYDVARINSLGVRGWINFVRQCEDAGQQVSFERCPPVMVGQMSMISNFMGARSQVVSVVAPYLCPSCSHEHLQLIEITPAAARAFAAPLACPKCSTPMLLDELPETYTRLFPGG